MEIILKQNSKDRHVKDYFDVGSVVIEDNFEYDSGQTNPIEDPNGIDCTAIDVIDICTDQTGIKYNEGDLWSRVPNKTTQGVDPRDTIGTLVKQGIQPISGGPRDTRWISYLRAEGDSGDYFENTRSAMLATKSSSMTNTNYYLEWFNTPAEGIVPQGVTRISGHSYKISGCRLAPTGLQFHMKDWTGVKKWIPKEVFNVELNKYGTTSLIPTTKETTANQVSYIQKCIDAIVNFLLAIKQAKTPPMITTVSTAEFSDKIISWAKAIAPAEGARPDLCNPGDLKVTTLTKSWGAKNGFQATDGGWIAKFPDVATGFKAQCNLLKLIAENQIIGYHLNRSFEGVMKVYANNPPQSYIDSIARDIPCELTDDVSTFL